MQYGSAHWVSHFLAGSIENGLDRVQAMLHNLVCRADYRIVSAVTVNRATNSLRNIRNRGATK
jgi:hypothetical protein